jgi:hypothetical protein
VSIRNRSIAVAGVVLLIGLAAWSATASAAPSGPVGRWMQVHTCDQLVSALDAQGLGSIAPSVVGDYFPNATPEELAAKDDICAGARPLRHFHFFSATGAFGSLDQLERQVDDGSWTLLDAHTMQVNDGTFRFDVDGGRLSLTPLITDEQKAEALAAPLQFSTAGWMVAVSYPGTTWLRVPCLWWC